jgi:hypothetical protein
MTQYFLNMRSTHKAPGCSACRELYSFNHWCLNSESITSA